MTREIISGTRTIVIDEINNTISAVTRSGLMPTMKISFNKDFVVKCNKKTISTTTIDMLAECLKIDLMAFDTVYNHIASYADNHGYNVSKSQFYALFNDDLNALVVFFNGASHKTRQLVLFDHCCTDHNAKMAGMISFSTYVKMNIYCLARRKKGCSVCAHCFAARQTKTYKEQALKLARAHVIATMCEWSAEDIPVDMIVSGGYKYFRLESFGDINNALQVRNYNTLARVLGLQHIRVTLWTKNPGIIQKAINDGLVLTNNLTIGLSSLKLNTPEIERAKRYSFIKFVFTVFSPEYVKEHNITINCGGRHCLSCLNCYERAAVSGELIIINELLK